MFADACLLAKGAHVAVAGAASWPVGRVVGRGGAGAGESTERGGRAMDYNQAAAGVEITDEFHYY